MNQARFSIALWIEICKSKKSLTGIVQSKRENS